LLIADITLHSTQRTACNEKTVTCRLTNACDRLAMVFHAVSCLKPRLHQRCVAGSKHPGRATCIRLHVFYTCGCKWIQVDTTCIRATCIRGKRGIISYAAFTPDDSPLTCIHLYLLSLSTCILYRRQKCRYGDMYPLVSVYMSTDTSGNKWIQLSLHGLRVSGVNSALGVLLAEPTRTTSVPRPARYGRLCRLG